MPWPTAGRRPPSPSPRVSARGRNGNNVSLPTEMTLMQENDLQNQTVVNALDDQFALLSDAITG